MEAPRILVKGLASGYEVEHLVRVFYPAAVVAAGTGTRGAVVYARCGSARLAAGVRQAPACRVRTAPLPHGQSVKLALCRLVYDVLCEATGMRPPWGLLTGVRPLNLLRKQLAAGGGEGARRHFLQACDVSREKFDMAMEIAARQAPVLEQSPKNAYSLYVSIPFCPTRCAYCSFVSRTVEREGHLLAPYLEKLAEELAQTARLAKENGLRLQTVYIGGGTPTVLSAAQLAFLLQTLERHFAPATTLEYTVEAGRPDCTDKEKLALLSQYGAGRISINPQSLNDEVLQAIGRRHTAADILRSYEDAREVGHFDINMDLIAGLPKDTPESFAATLSAVAALRPENITLHTLTLKRASDLVVESRAAQSHPAAMLAAAYPQMRQNGYAPYYLYRQKSGVENLENTGWALPGKDGLYNIFIMEEAHTILAVGAGASTKLVAPGGARIQRIYNHKLPAEYLKHFDEVMDRKRGVTQFYARNLDPETTG
ncbi:coproporphyrinogen dehydrogenase HemZ [Ruminococcaceae bacterium OttesenSCG-928-O06]|nr:coproporphyrinogen dehydrogenase HemZ [Ruminococcaceae bacterium OttesenSCG-928-O06]